MRFGIVLPYVAALIFSANSGLLRAQVAWVARFDDALKTAQAEQKLIVLDISTSWCPPCQRMAREVHTDKNFIEFTRTQVFMLLDAEKDEDGIRIARKFDVRAYPTILVLDAQGREIDRLIGGTSAPDLIRDLKQIFNNPLPFDQLINEARARPDDVQLQYEAGKRAFQRQEFDKARQCLDRAARLSDTLEVPIQADTLSLLVAVSFRTGKYKDALDALDALSRLDPQGSAQSTDLKLLRARILVSLNRDDEAFDLINAILRSSPSRGTKDSVKEILAEMPSRYRKGDRDYENAINKARDNLRKKKFDAALELAMKAEALAPQDPQAHLLIAAANLEGSAQEKNPARKNASIATGLQELRLARRLDWEDMSIYLAAKGYLAARYLRLQANSPEAQRSYLEGEARFGEGRLKEAMAAYEKTIRLEPDFGKAYLYMGDCYFRMNDFETALHYYQQAASKSPTDAAAYRFGADALARLGRADEADSTLILGILADPEYPMIRNLRGTQIERHASYIPLNFLLVSADVDSFDEAMFEGIPAETVPAWREYVHNKILWRQEKYAETFPKESFYHATFEEEYDCLSRLVEEWSRMKAADPALRNEGLDYLRQVAVDDHLDSFVYLELFTEEYRPSYERWMQENSDKAKTYVTRFLCGAPAAKSRGAYNSSAIEAYNAGAASQRAGDRVKAVELYEKALAQEPDMIPALANLGILRLQAGKLDQARPLLEKWLRLEPDSSRGLAAMSQLEARDGNLAAAAELLGKAADREQNPDVKASYLRNLERLRSPQGNQAIVVTRPPADSEPLTAAEAALNDSRWTEAIKILEALYPKLADGPDKNRAELMLSVAHCNAGNLKEARTYVTRLLARDPANVPAQEILKAIEKKDRSGPGIP